METVQLYYYTKIFPLSLVEHLLLFDVHLVIILTKLIY